jgi:tight adherence protein C
MTLLVSLGLFLTLLAAISAFGYRAYARPARMYQHVGRRTPAASAILLEPKKPAGETMAKWFHQIGGMLPISPQNAKGTRRDLISAGWRSDTALQVYYGVKVVLSASLLLLALLLRDQLTSNPMLRIVLVIGGGLVGFVAPSFLLGKRIKSRQDKLRLGLPDALDLLVISVEAGMGLDQAIQNVSRELAITHKELADELSLVTLEMRAGKRRADALRNLADRTGEPELRKLVAIMIQSDRFGTGIGEAIGVRLKVEQNQLVAIL